MINSDQKKPDFDEKSADFDQNRHNNGNNFNQIEL